MRMLVVFLRRAIGTRIVLIAIDVAADLVLLVVDLSAFLAGQVTAVGGAILVNFLVGRRFLTLKVARFAWRQLARTNALSDASLLVAFTVVDAVVRNARGTPVILGCEICMVEARAVFVRSLE